MNNGLWVAPGVQTNAVADRNRAQTYKRVKFERAPKRDEYALVDNAWCVVYN